MLDEWRFCPRCRAELDREHGRATCAACGFVAYANSAPTASAVCTDEQGRVLLARRAVEPYEGRWDVPGGFLEEGEHPEAALHRELREETGLEIEPLEPLGTWVEWYGDGPGARATLNLVWTARVVGGDARPADDVSELAWFGPDELPPADELAFSMVGAALTAWKQQAQRPRIASEP